MSLFAAAGVVASWVWGLSHAIGAVLALRSWWRLRHRFYLYFGIAWAVLAAWWLTAGAGGVLHVFNALVAPVVGSFFGLLALASMAAFARRRIVTVRQGRDGAIALSGFANIPPEPETPTPVETRPRPS